MIRNVLGGLFAVILGVMIVGKTMAYSRNLYEIPEGLDFENPDDIAILVAAMTKEAKTILVSGHMIAAFLAGLIAAKISSQAKLGTGMIASMVILIATVTEVMMVSYSIGFSSLLIFATLFAAYAGAKVGSGGEVYIET